LDENVVVVITVHASESGLYHLRNICDAPKVVRLFHWLPLMKLFILIQALESLLGANLQYIMDRKHAYFDHQPGQNPIGQTWGIVITCATGFHKPIWRKEIRACLSSWYVVSGGIFLYSLQTGLLILYCRMKILYWWMSPLEQWVTFCLW
jgi:hypothetical protein